MSSSDKTAISLVLGSGGARGLAHIGVIHELHDRGYEIHSISGCSAGALVGGIYAAGKLKEFEDWVRAISKLDIVTLLDISWGKDGLVKGDRIIGTLVDLVGDVAIEDLSIPFTAIAADIEKEKEVWLNSGSLFDAIRSSISLPLLFTPVRYGEGYIIDGGVLNPVPIAPTFHDDTDLKIAVNLGGTPEKHLKYKQEVKRTSSNSSSLRKKLDRFIGDIKGTSAGDAGRGRDVYDIANQAFDAMQGTIARQKLAAYPPDIEIVIARNACGMLEFDRASEMIELGRRKARESLDYADSRRQGRGGAGSTAT
ncbi:MAG: patatin-like phospholipase family protein [Woeseiaceae bacterium]